MLTKIYTEGDADNEKAVLTLEKIVAAHGARLTRQVLEVGAKLADPGGWREPGPYLSRVNASAVRQLCQQALHNKK